MRKGIDETNAPRGTVKMSATLLFEIHSSLSDDQITTELGKRWPSGFVDVSVSRKPGSVICELGWYSPGTRKEWISAVIEYLSSVATDIFYYPTYDDLIPWEQYETAKRVVTTSDIAGGDLEPWSLPNVPAKKFRVG
jgi:hypothetical protein